MLNPDLLSLCFPVSKCVCYQQRSLLFKATVCTGEGALYEYYSALGGQGPGLLLDGLWQMTLQEATVHTNKIRLHWIELKQTLEEVIYRWDAACKIVLLDSITALYCNLRWMGRPSESCPSWWCGCLDRVAFRGFRNGSLPKINGELLPRIIDSLWYRLLNSVATPALQATQHFTAESSSLICMYPLVQAYPEDSYC